MIYTQHYESPLGGILLAADDTGLTGLWFEGQKYFARTLDAVHQEQETAVLSEASRWLDVYFGGQEPDIIPHSLQQMEDAKVEVKRPFPQEAELAEKSERLAALNVALNIGGKDKPNSRERQKHDGKTSIKRLLRRMGVESAASAAPKKDKEMEVAI